MKGRDEKEKGGREGKEGYELFALSTVSPFFVLFRRRHLIPQALQRDPLPKKKRKKEIG